MVWKVAIDNIQVVGNMVNVAGLIKDDSGELSANFTGTRQKRDGQGNIVKVNLLDGAGEPVMETLLDEAGKAKHKKVLNEKTGDMDDVPEDPVEVMVPELEVQPHMFHFSLMEVHQMMMEEDVDQDEALEVMITKVVRRMREGDPDAPKTPLKPFPTSFALTGEIDSDMKNTRMRGASNAP